jgi:leucyl-tRNA synthetase
MLLLMAPLRRISPRNCALGLPYSVHQQSWPEYDAEKAAEEMVTLVVQINGKVRERIQVPAGIAEEQAKQIALESGAARKALDDSQPKKVIFVAGRDNLEPKVNIVV